MDWLACWRKGLQAILYFKHTLTNMRAKKKQKKRVPLKLLVILPKHPFASPTVHDCKLPYSINHGETSLALQEMINNVEHVQRFLLHRRLQLHLCQQPLLSNNALVGQFCCLSLDCWAFHLRVSAPGYWMQKLWTT